MGVRGKNLRIKFARRDFLKTAAGLACLPLFPAHAEMRNLHLVHNIDFPPYEYGKNGQTFGLLPEKADGISRKLKNVNIKHESMAWRRAQALVQSGRADGLTAFPSEARKKYCNFTKRPLMHVEAGIFFSSSNPRINELKKISSLSDLKNFNVVDQKGNGWAEQTIAPHTDVTWVPHFEQIFRLILSNRFDVHVAVSYETVRWNLYQLNFNENDLIGIKVPELVKPIPLHLGLRKTLTGHQKILDAFDDFLAEQK